MKLRISRADLAAALTWGSQHLVANPTMPLHAALLVEAEGDQATITGVTWEATTRSTVPADVLEPGRIGIPGRLVASVVATYRGDDVEIAVDGQQATLASGSASFRISIIDPADYPAPAATAESHGTVDGHELAHAVSQVAGAADPNVAAKPWLGGIQVTGEGERLHLWATDRYRVAHAAIDWTPSEPGCDAGALVPVRALADTAKQLAGPVQLALGEKFGLTSGRHGITLTQLDTHDQPDVLARIPRDYATTAVAETKPLLAAVKRASLANSDKKPHILIGAADDGVTVRATGDTGGAAFDTVPGGRTDGEPMQVAFKTEYLLAGLTKIDTDEVQINFTSPTRPCLLHPSDEESGFRYLLMPVRL